MGEKEWIKIGVPFRCTIPKFDIMFDAICIDDNGEDSTHQYTIEFLKPYGDSPKGHRFTVEADWFNTDLTGRFIYYNPDLKYEKE